jgi:hypothetical protein
MLNNSAELFARLEDSGLLSKSIVARREELLKASSAEEAASELVRLQLLTSYQSEVLVHAKTVPFVIVNTSSRTSLVKAAWVTS